MAIYFIRLSDYKVERVIPSEECVITAISANPQSPFRFACGYADGTVIIWDIEKEKAELRFKIPKGAPIAVEFCPFDKEPLLFISDNGIPSLICLVYSK